MASTKAQVCFTFALLVSTTIVLSSAAISPFCATAENKALCTQLVNGGKTWRKAMTNALNDVIKRVKAGKPIVDGVGAKLPAILWPNAKASIVKGCHEGYDDLLFSLQTCFEYLKNDPFSSLRSSISSFASAFSGDCIEGLEQFGVELPEVSRYNDDMLRLAQILFAIAEKKPSI